MTTQPPPDSQPEPDSQPGPDSQPTRNAGRRALQRLIRDDRRPSRPNRSTKAFGAGRDPSPLSDSVAAFIDDRGWNQVAATATVTAQWETIVGSDVAAHARPETILDGVLTIRTDSTAWATQLRLLLPQVRSAIEAVVGTHVISDIRITAPSGPTWKAGPRRVKGRGPRDTYG